MLSFDVVDVFTDRPFAGNQLAVVHGAGSLSTEQCLAIAREFNYSETTFPVPHSASSYATRIFTPGGEIPFAGHPTLGTAWVLRDRGMLGLTEIVQHCGAGKIGVRFLSGGLVELSAAPRDLAGPVDESVVAELLRDLGLSAADLVGPVWIAGTGFGFVHIPVTEEAVARARPSFRPLREYADRLAAAGPTRDPVEGINLHHVSGSAPELEVRSRVFVPGIDVAEDPATGSAAAGLGMAFVALGRLPEGGRYTITQGVEMGRPSRIFGRVDVSDGRVDCVNVAGRVQRVATGEIAAPAQ